MRRNKTNRFVLFAMLGDAVVLYAAFLTAYFIRMHNQSPPLMPLHTLQGYNPAALITIGLCLLIFVFYGLYDLRRQLSMIDEYARLIKAVTFALVLALTMTFFFKYYERSRFLVMIFWATAVVFELGFRWLLWKIVKVRRSRGWDTLNMLILGVDNKRLAAEKILQLHPELGYRCAGNLALDPKRDLGASKEEPISAELAKKIAAVMVKIRLDGIILTFPIKYYEQMIGIVTWCEEKGLEAHYITSVVDIMTSKAIQEELQENVFLENTQDSQQFWKGLLKRLMDEIVSLGVVLVTSPLWLLIAIAIKLDSAGPVFFKQERVGRFGRHFVIYKFRTMHTSAPKYSVTPRQKSDPRITRVGAFLRQTSLDELPQFINVIKGDMSLVGPRPEQPFLVKKYNRAIYHRRHLVLPGLTGLWQVSGRSDKPMEENVKYDLYYIKHHSLLFDLVILARTVPTVLSKRGAY
ncbi:MAG: sugar transferase [candidate division FCPU426 bacterium]